MNLPEIKFEITKVKVNEGTRRLAPGWTVHMEPDRVIQQDIVIINVKERKHLLPHYKMFNKTVIIKETENRYRVVQLNNKRRNKLYTREKFHEEFFTDLI